MQLHGGRDWRRAAVNGQVAVPAGGQPRVPTSRGRDPLAKFEETLDTVGAPGRDRFYAGNMADLLGGGLALARA